METQWYDLKYHGWIPLQTRLYPQHEPRNGLLLCSNHRIWFDNYFFFLRFSPKVSLIPLTSGIVYLQETDSEVGLCQLFR
jgi:hypothetical protein